MRGDTSGGTERRCWEEPVPRGALASTIVAVLPFVNMDSERRNSFCVVAAAAHVADLVARTTREVDMVRFQFDP